MHLCEVFITELRKHVAKYDKVSTIHRLRNWACYGEHRMKKRHYTTRQYRLAAGLILALAAPAIAQVPPLNLPGLPLPPGVANPATGSTNATTPPPLMIPVPGKSAMSEPKKETNVSKASTSNPINPTDMLPPEMLKEAGVAEDDDQPADAKTDDDDGTITAVTDDEKEADTTAGATNPDTGPKTDTAATGAVPPITPGVVANDWPAGLPPPPMAFGGNVPAPSSTAIGVLTPPPGALPFGPNLPGTGDLANNAPEERKDLKSWETTLAPSIIPPATKFNYKRVVLPATIYRAKYGVLNRHLPIRRTNEDLDLMFLRAVAKNDINSTRALLKTGRNVNQMNAYGDSALIVAVRSGAYDTARLLLARGANPHFYGQGGKTAFDYARQQGKTDFAKQLLRQGA